MTIHLAPLLPLPALAAIALVAVACELVPLWRGARAVVSLGRRLAISALWLGAIALALAPLLGLSVEHERRATATGVLLVDRSRSMATEDAGAGESRYDAAREAARRLAREVAGVRWRIEEFPAVAPETSGGWAPTSPLGDALAHAARPREGDAPAAVVLLSDGDATAGRDPEAAARDARASGVPVFTVGFGRADRAPPPRIAAVEVRAPERVARASRASIGVSTELEGLAGEPIEVELLVDGKPVARTPVEATGPAVRREVHFDVTLDEPGLHAITAEVRSGERRERASRRVRVLPGDVTVALIDAPGRWEHRYLRRALEDSPRVRLRRVDLWGPPDSDELRAQATSAALVAIQSADVIVLGDLRRRALDPSVGAALRAAVDERGKGLIVLGGQAAFGAATDLGLAPLLPAPIGFELTPVARTFRAVETDAGRSLLASALELGEDEARALIGRLPALESHVPLGEARPGAVVLLEAPGRRPLVAVARWGLGRTGIVATDETWRWAFQPAGRGRPGPVEAHRALVRELVAQVAPRDAGLAAPLAVAAPDEPVLPGATLVATVDAAAVGSASARVVAILVDESGRTVAETAVPPGESNVHLAVPGTISARELVLRVMAQDGAGSEVARDERVVRVARPTLEDRVGVPTDVARLVRIADAGGGAAFAQEDVARGRATRAIASALEPARPAVREARPLAAGAGYVAFLALLLSASWSLRRGAGLR